MNKTYCIILLALCTLALPARAQGVAQAPEGIGVDSLRLERNGKYLTVAMNLDLGGLEVKGDRAVLFTPVLHTVTDSIELKSVGIYSRRSYYRYARLTKGNMLTGPQELAYKASQVPDGLSYEAIIPYRRWMDGAILTLRRADYGCCATLLARQDSPLATFRDSKPDYMPLAAYVQPRVEAVKARALTGTAYIDFPVNQTDIRPDYRDNRRELDKILGTIDSVRTDRDITITALSIKGYASPEGSYELNTRLAAARTEALKQYVSRLYRFDNGFIQTAYEPEDWAGLRRYVEASGLEHRAEILALIDSDREPDNKEWKLKSTYPDDYRHLLAHCYPGLRRSDYRIDYVVRAFSDVDEIRALMHTRPQKLSLQELFLVAQQCEPGSDEFNEVFELAVRLYPDDPVANLNAANTALRRADVQTARRYLQKAGDMPQATYARGICALLEGDTDRAKALLLQAQAQGVTQAKQALDELAVED